MQEKLTICCSYHISNPKSQSPCLSYSNIANFQIGLWDKAKYLEGIEKMREQAVNSLGVDNRFLTRGPHVNRSQYIEQL